MIYFTSDTHFNHDNIIKYCGRPFSNVLEMNEVMIENWNKVVKKEDTIYHLGDFGFGEYKYIIDSLNGNKILILGSHDGSVLKYESCFKEIWKLREINIDGQSITLCHYAMRVWPKSHYNTWHLYGHSHGKLEEWGKSFDVGVDSWGFTPLSFEQVKGIMENKPNNFNLI